MGLGGLGQGGLLWWGLGFQGWRKWGWAGRDSSLCRRKNTLASSTVRAAALVPVDRLLRALGATPRVGSAIAHQVPQDPSAASAPPATGGSRSRAADVSISRATGGQVGSMEWQVCLSQRPCYCPTLHRLPMPGRPL